ncbi:MAG: hypothetical protein KDA61_23045, partial [Planctomycetales bacterium]|nr:hypothetical protein [Planctomycetales bacterium]
MSRKDRRSIETQRLLRRFGRCAASVALLALSTLSGAGLLRAETAGEDQADASSAMTLQVDATQLHRHLLRSEMTYPTEPGERWFWYPQWIPGVHGPSGQATNLAEVIFEDEQGNRLPWRRDALNLCRFGVAVPSDVHRIRIRLTYIANQPTTISRGVDSYGTSRLLVVNFNTCVLYPEGKSVSEMPVKVRLRLPWQWQAGSALREAGPRQEGWVEYETASLENVIDAPVVAGRHFRRLEFEEPGVPPTRFHI